MSESKIHINREIWTWRMPSPGNVVIRDPNRKKTVVRPSFIVKHWFDHRDGRPMPEYSDGPTSTGVNVTPAMVKLYIEKTLLAGKR